MRTILKLLTGAGAVALVAAPGIAVPAAAKADVSASPIVSIADAAVAEGHAGWGEMIFTVTLDRPTDHDMSIGYATSDGTATDMVDYLGTKWGSVEIEAGQTSKEFSIGVAGDLLPEPDETFTVDLTYANPAPGGFAGGTAVGTIVDDDTGQPEVSIGDVTVTEGDSGTTKATFPVTMDKPSSEDVQVSFATKDGTATAPDDYAFFGGTRVFNPGETSQEITIDVVGETAVEDDETFTVELSNPQYAVLADGSGTGTIVDDDDGGGTPPVPNLSIDDVSIGEGDSGTTAATFTVTLDQPSAQIVQAVFGTADGTAAAPADYAFLGGTAVFNPGETSKSVAIDVAGDTLVEDDETFTVELSNPQNAQISDGSGIATIVDDDSGNAPVNEPPVADDVTVSATSGEPVTLTVTTSDPNGDELSYAITQDQAHGTVEGDGPQYSYTSDDQFEGTDTFLVEVCDPSNACDTAEVTVNVTAPEPPPGDDNDSDDDADTGDDDTDADGNGNGGTTNGTGDGGGPDNGKQLALTGAAVTQLLVGTGIGVLVLGAALLLATRWSRRRTGTAR